MLSSKVSKSAYGVNDRCDKQILESGSHAKHPYRPKNHQSVPHRGTSVMTHFDNSESDSEKIQGSQVVRLGVAGHQIMDVTWTRWGGS